MALKKNKTETYLNVYNLQFELDMDLYYYYDWDYDWDYDDEYCTEPCCYIDFQVKESVYKTYIHKRGGWISKENRLIGQLIDMDSIYEIGTLYYRERMLSRLLGDEKFHKEVKNTIGDYFPKINK